MIWYPYGMGKWVLSLSFDSNANGGKSLKNEAGFMRGHSRGRYPC